MTKLQLAQKRNYFKFVLSGMFRLIDNDVLTEWEQEEWSTIFNIRDELMDKFDENSKLMGLNVPEHKCWCGKPAKYTLDHVEKGKESKWVCKKHLKN